ncbi:hypothetical protein [Beijerinckia indica]|uniref:hypothetical protein n=1 Tax=Beijerinckia indica TaxID=533 RepID=UPI0011D14421|nr:hypothetical protein [Beijerinckia indica]
MAVYAAGTGSDFYPADFSGKNMHYEKKMDMMMSTGKPMRLYIVKMRGQRMVVVPAEALEELLSRAEGHTISLQ